MTLPDTIPDLAAALARQPALRVLSLAGYHDLATPFRQTELDLARLGAQPAEHRDTAIQPARDVTRRRLAGTPEGRHRGISCVVRWRRRSRAYPFTHRWRAQPSRLRTPGDAQGRASLGAARRRRRGESPVTGARRRPLRAARPAGSPRRAVAAARHPRQALRCGRRSRPGTATSTGRRARRGSTSTSSRRSSRPRRCAGAPPSGCRLRGCPCRIP